MNNLSDPPENLWTVEDVARFVKCSKSWVYKASESGELPCVRIGAMVRFDPNAVKRFLMQNANASA
jgi:excisionase family DNA binding protein